MAAGLLSFASKRLKRSGINVGLLASGHDYATIDHIKGGNQFGGAGQNQWKTGTIWHQQIDSKGWPSYNASRQAGICGIYIPHSDDFASRYVIKGKGSGRISLSTGTWTFHSSDSSGAAEQSNGIYNVTDSGSGWRIELTYSGPRQTIGINAPIVNAIKDMQFFRKEDEEDLFAGYVFRRPFKQFIADQNFEFLRFMNWTGGNRTKACRFEHRTLPSYAQWTPQHYDWTASPKYGETVGVNQMTLDAVDGTPDDIQHGEIATCRIGEGTLRAAFATANSITKNAVPTVVVNTASQSLSAVTWSGGVATAVATASSHGFTIGTTIKLIVSGVSPSGYNGEYDCTVTTSKNFTYSISDPGGSATVAGSVAKGHGFNTGDTVVHFITAGMTQLDWQPSKIHVVDAVTYTLDDIDTTSFGTFSGTCRVEQFITLQVGSGNDRTAYPVTFGTGNQLAGRFGDGYIATGDYKTFYFDKNQSAMKDASGKWVMGVWLFDDRNADKGNEGMIPVEVCVKLVNEVMEMTRSDGRPVDPIDCWINIPHRGMISADPDYSPESNMAIGMVNIALNGNTEDGVIWPGLDSRCKLRIEYSNETWNSANQDWQQTFYLTRMGDLRWNLPQDTKANDRGCMHAFRSTLMVRDILTGGFDRSRLHFVMAGWGSRGVTGGTTEPNDIRISGDVYTLTDPFVTDYTPPMAAVNLNPNGDLPIALHDDFSWAGYIYAPSDATLPDIAASWLSHAGDPVAQEADCAEYVALMIGDGIPTGETLYRYGEIILPMYADRVTAYGKKTAMYEGGWDHAVAVPNIPFNFIATTNGTTSLTAIPGGTAMQVGRYVVGRNIPDYTTVVSSSVGSATLSQAAIGSNVVDLETYPLENYFLRACKRSQAWADAVRDFMDKFKDHKEAFSPSAYVWNEVRWGHIYPNPYSFNVGGVEWSGVDSCLKDQGLRNRGG